MKPIIFAILFTTIQAYSEAEGPTKVDFGENDDIVIPRSDHQTTGWTNPLQWHDNGDGDEKVLAERTNNL